MPSTDPDRRGLFERPRLVALLAVAGFAVLGLLKFLYFFLDDLTRGRPDTLGLRALEEGSSVAGELLFFPLLLLLCLRVPLERGAWPRRLPVYGAAMVGLSLLHTTWRAVARGTLAPVLGLGAYDYGDMRWRYLMELPNDLIGMAAIVAIIHGLRHWEEARRRELRTAQLESRLAQAQLQSLRLQLQPHFLFNAINTVSALIYEDPARADRMLGRLSDLLRAMLQGSPTQESTLTDELDLVRAYLEIMRGRFEERLEASVHLAPEAAGALVPQFLLQPLVENALRHGVDQDGRAAVHIEASRDNGRLVVEIRDRGPGFAPGAGTSGSGIGLANTAGRLAALHGSAARLDFENVEGGGALVRVTLPYREAGG